MQKNAWITALGIASVLFITGCGGDSDTSVTVPPVVVEFVNLEAVDGEADIESTSRLKLTIDPDIEGLAAADFTVTIDEPFGVTRGNLIPTGGGEYTLEVTITGGDTNGSPDITVTADKQGYIFNPSSHDTPVFYVPIVVDPGTVTIISSSDRATSAWGDVLSVAIDNLNSAGTGSVVYEWLIDGDPAGSNATMPLTAEHIGKTITVKAQRNSWDDIWTPESDPIGPIANGWTVRTVLYHYPHPDSPNHLDYRFADDFWDLAIDSNDNLYSVGHIDWFSWCAVQIDPSATILDPTVRPTVTVFIEQGDLPGSGQRYVATGPDDAVYLSSIWGQHVSKYDQPGGGSFDWQSDNLVDATGLEDNALDGPFAIDANGNIFLTTEWWHDRSIIKITPAGAVSILAGGLEIFKSIQGITIGPDGFVYVADGWSDGVIKRIDPDTGDITNFIGGIAWGNPLALMRGLTFGNDGNFYVVDRLNEDEPVIRKITPEGIVYTIAGNLLGTERATSDGIIQGIYDGHGTTAKFRNPFGIVCTSDGTVFVMDNADNEDNNANKSVIRMIYYDTSTTAP